MFDLLVHYRNGQDDIAQYDIPTYAEAVDLGAFYTSHTTEGHPFQVVSYAILPQS